MRDKQRHMLRMMQNKAQVYKTSLTFRVTRVKNRFKCSQFEWVEILWLCSKCWEMAPVRGISLNTARLNAQKYVQRSTTEVLLHEGGCHSWLLYLTDNILNNTSQLTSDLCSDDLTHLAQPNNPPGYVNFTFNCVTSIFDMLIFSNLKMSISFFSFVFFERFIVIFSLSIYRCCLRFQFSWWCSMGGVRKLCQQLWGHNVVEHFNSVQVYPCFHCSRIGKF